MIIMKTRTQETICCPCQNFLVNFPMNKSLSILRYEVMLRVNVQVSLLRHHYTCGGACQTKIHIHIIMLVNN